MDKIIIDLDKVTVYTFEWECDIQNMRQNLKLIFYLKFYSLLSAAILKTVWKI